MKGKFEGYCMIVAVCNVWQLVTLYIVFRVFIWRTFDFAIDKFE